MVPVVVFPTPRCNATTTSYNVILQQHQQVVAIPDSPRDIAYTECLSLLKQSKWPIAFDELVKTACDRNEQVRHYLGHELKLNRNWKLKNVRDMLLNHESVKQVQERPTVLLWIEKGVSNNNVIEATDGSVASVVCEVEKEPVDEKNYQGSKKLLDMNGVEPCEKISMTPTDTTTLTTHTTLSTEAQAAITKNILYGSQIIQQKIIPHTLRHNLSEFPNKVIEDTCSGDTTNEKLENIREGIFWQRFKELEQKSPDGTVKGQDLRGSTVLLKRTCCTTPVQKSVLVVLVAFYY